MREILAYEAGQREPVTEALRKLQITDPEARYDLEYMTAVELAVLTNVPSRFSGTHYWFWSPVLEPEFLKSVFSPKQGARILDAGAGNGTLLRTLHALGWAPEQTTGVDVSAKAAERICNTGATAVRRPLADLPRGFESDVIFLSYFVDRDSNQRRTFEKTEQILRPGGVIILEGLFPCVLEDSHGVSYGSANVTLGRDAEEDIGLVIAEFARLGLELKKRSDGERYVYSLDGPEVLPSYILVFKKK